MTNDNKCLGIFGWMFGHKYIKEVAFELVYRSDYCWRCGKRVQE